MKPTLIVAGVCVAAALTFAARRQPPQQSAFENPRPHDATFHIERGQRVALVACDLIGIPPAVVGEAREMIHSATGILGGHVMISATHTHRACK